MLKPLYSALNKKMVFDLGYSFVKLHYIWIGILLQTSDKDATTKQISHKQFTYLEVNLSEHAFINTWITRNTSSLCMFTGTWEVSRACGYFKASLPVNILEMHCYIFCTGIEMEWLCSLLLSFPQGVEPLLLFRQPIANPERRRWLSNVSTWRSVKQAWMSSW